MVKFAYKDVDLNDILDTTNIYQLNTNFKSSSFPLAYATGPGTDASSANEIRDDNTIIDA